MLWYAAVKNLASLAIHTHYLHPLMLPPFLPQHNMLGFLAQYVLIANVRTTALITASHLVGKWPDIQLKKLVLHVKKHTIPKPPSLVPKTLRLWLLLLLQLPHRTLKLSLLMDFLTSLTPLGATPYLHLHT